MKRILILFFLMATTVWGSELPFTRGVNLTNWFQTSSPQQIQFTRFTRQDFVDIKSLGCDVIRLPVNLHFMTNGAPDYAVDTLFYYFFDQVVDMAEELELHLILDNHTFDPSVSTDPNVGNVLVPVWRQIADHYKHRSTYLYYEVLNEPHGISDAVWNTIQQQVIETIREVDSVHTIIVGPAGWNSYFNLQYMPAYADSNLIYTFHFYDPFVFTHQGASWTDPSMVSLSGVPFPYDAARMPNCPPELVGTWIQDKLENYPNEGTVAHVKQLIDIAAAFKTERDVPLFCGEFGVYIPNSDNEDRVFWYDVTRSYLEEQNIGWTIWDYKGSFGLFEAGSNELFNYDLNIPLVEALGFTAPPQFEFVLEPDTTGFDFYTDYIGTNIYEANWMSNGSVNYYHEDNPVEGNFCLHWSNVDQYNHVGFYFRPLKDLSELVIKGYAIDFWIRGDSPGAKFDIRFIDTKTENPNDHPWRMGVTIDETMAQWNGEWFHLQIPLSNLTEKGSWDNGEWFDPQGEFDWGAIDNYQIVAEHHSLNGMNFWFDNICVVDAGQTAVNNSKSKPLHFELKQNYPNPFNPVTSINYRLSEPNFVTIKIFNLMGQQVRVLVGEKKLAGEHTIFWNGKDDNGIKLPSSVYFCRMEVSDFVRVKKMSLIQ